MTAKLSIVIPTLNSENYLCEVLNSLLEGVQIGLICEVIVSDGGSTDKTLEIADDAGAILLNGIASRGGQLKRGCGVVRGHWLLVLHADTTLESGWTASVIEHMNRKKGAAYFRIRFSKGGVMSSFVAGWANLRARIFSLPYGDQGLLIRTADYLKVGGFPDQVLMEDVEIMCRLHQEGVKLYALSHCAYTSSIRFERSGWFCQGFRNLRALVLYFAGVSPEKLLEKYRR
ncbi:MAG: TIGR04283 family arsenosugar biosynthesis glycosyltransferase [Aestuariivita sp.]|nr:TIGR04283 family arsenosugar biosynthesis glycosyltransferase [Aestuariivita sp.]